MCRRKKRHEERRREGAEKGERRREREGNIIDSFRHLCRENHKRAVFPFH